MVTRNWISCIQEGVSLIFEWYTWSHQMLTLNETTFLVTMILVGIVVVIFTYVYLKWARIYRIAYTIPGPPGFPLIGNALSVVGTPKEVMNKCASFVGSYPDICRLWIGPQLVVLISDPELVKNMLVKQTMIEKYSYGIAFLHDFMGEGLVTATGMKWRHHRKLLGTNFNSARLLSMLPTLDTQSKILVEQMQNRVNGAEFTVRHLLSRCMLDIVCETMMGVELGAQRGSDSEFLKAVERLPDIATERFSIPWLHPRFIFNNTKLGKEYKNHLLVATNFVEKVIRTNREASSKKRNDSGESDHDNPQNTRKSMLDYLIEWTGEDQSWSAEELLLEVDTFLMAGIETTSTAIGVTMLMLSTHNDVQEKAFEEIRAIYRQVDDEDRSVTMDDLAKMVYLERVIKEALRICTLVEIIGRVATHDTTIGDRVIPKDTIVIAMVSMMHKSEKFWQDPRKFDPDRFSPEEVEKRHPFAHLPFGAGPRNCVGSKFAMMTIKVIISMVLRKFVLKKDRRITARDIDTQPGVTAKPSEEITIRIEQR